MVQTLTEAQASYLAGFIDGDGSIMAQIVKRPDYVLRYQIRLSVVFFQKKKRTHFLTQFQKEIGSGTLRDRGDGICELALVGANTVFPFLRQVRPFLRIKHKQANLVIQIIEQLPLTKKSPERFLDLCKLADQVSLLNDTKSRLTNLATVEVEFLDLGLIKKQ